MRAVRRHMCIIIKRSFAFAEPQLNAIPILGGGDVAVWSVCEHASGVKLWKIVG